MTDLSGAEKEMGIGRFAAILDAYGAEAGRWPAAERAAAARLLAGSAEARALHERASALDLVLSRSVAPAPSAALRSAILDAAPPARRAAPRRRSLWQAAIGTIAGELGGLRPAGALLSVALLLGIVVGGAVGTGTGTAAEAEIDIVHLALLDEQFSGY